MSAGIAVVPVAAAHRNDWETLYAGYAAFYRVEQTARHASHRLGLAARPGA